VTDPARILLVRLSALGDVVLCTPAVRALKKRFPRAAIDWLVEAQYVPLLEGNPHARPLSYDKEGRHRGGRGFLALRQELAARGYDLVVDLQDKPKTWLLRGVAPSSTALHKRSAAELLWASLGRDAVQTRAHAVDLALAALAPLGVEPDGAALEVPMTAAMKAEAASLSIEAGTVGLAPGARWATKRWPPERFAALARELAARGRPVTLIGGPGDRAAIQAVRERLSPGLVVGDTLSLGVGRLAATIARLSLVVAGDSGPVHLSSAMGTPVVSIFGPTSPLRWRPLTETSRAVRVEMPCSPCSNHGQEKCPLGHHACMRDLPMETVLSASLEVIR
jgi:heptosyltransferase-2